MVLPGLLVQVVLTAATALLGPGTAAAPDPGQVPAPPTAQTVPVQPAAPVQPASGCEPSKILDLTNWKITLPLPKPDNATGPLEIVRPALDDYTHPVFFRPDALCDAVLFRAPVNGPTTSGSKYPRSELREMADGGTDRASWSSTAGTHRITVSEAFTHLPLVKPHLVGVQIHDAADDISVIRLEGTNLWITNGDNPHHKLITDRYVLGTRFEVTYEVSGGTIRVFYNGEPQTTIPYRFRNAYFKTGAYTQANCTNSSPCSSDNYGETAVYSVSTFHHVTTWDLIWDWIFTWVPPTLLAVVVLVIGYRLYRRLRPRGQHARSRL